MLPLSLSLSIYLSLSLSRCLISSFKASTCSSVLSVELCKSFPAMATGPTIAVRMFHDEHGNIVGSPELIQTPLEDCVVLIGSPAPAVNHGVSRAIPAGHIDFKFVDVHVPTLDFGLAPADVAHTCQQCAGYFQRLASLSKCSTCAADLTGCISVRYCSPYCQKLAWSSHKPFCASSRSRRIIQAAHQFMNGNPQDGDFMFDRSIVHV